MAITRHVMRIRALAASALAALIVAPTAGAFQRGPELERVASIFAMRPAEVRCPDVGEWNVVARAEFAAEDPELLFGVTHLHDDWLMLRPDLCVAAAHVDDDTIHPSVRSLAVLTLVHESYHLRRWSGRLHEGKVQCQAIRHFRIGAQLLGASPEQAERLYWHALIWHYGLARPGSRYAWKRCRVP